ncbi:unnamed protein product [Paramecium octaurelia]|uniref:Cyclic nucleotide-binding domain-containing protein n=1 Tax=Paramecium octaurelia TaxID=43137 RepID=A0A8S1V8T2_PAROT|nr:unnamed protein product [Paramecium octaurelia]
MNSLRKKSVFQMKQVETPSTESTTRKSLISKSKRAKTEHSYPEVSQFEPSKKRNREQLLPQTHQQYLKAKRDIEYTYLMQQRRRQKTQHNEIPFDLKMAYIIKRQSVTGRKILHKSSFEESISSPITKKKLDSICEETFQLQPIKKDPILEQECLGYPSLHQEWDKRWESLFETFFEMQAVKSKNISQQNETRKDSRVKFSKGIVMKNNQRPINTRINNDEILVLKRELSKQPINRDILRLEPIFSKNKFLSRFNEIIRKIIIQQCQLREYQPDELVLSNEINCDKVFVIVLGSCKVVMTSFNKDQEILGRMVIRSIYDGYHINVDNLLIEKKIEDIKKMNNLSEANLQQYVKSEIYSQEKTVVIEISREIYDNVLTYAIDEEMREKIELLQKIKILGMNKDLRPLAAVLHHHEYKFGDLIISANQEIRHCYFVKSGRVKVTICTRKQRELYNYLTQSNQIELYDFSEESSVVKTSKNIDHCGKILKTSKNNHPVMEMNIHIDIKSLEVGDFFGGSSLLTQQEIISTNRYKKDKLALVSLIALTPVVELYSIDSMEFETLPDGFQHQLKELSLSQSEFDDFDVNKIVNDYDQWSMLKQAYYKSLVKK